MLNKPTVTIGMPAYNEEANIGHLFQDLLKQDTSEYILEKIVVASDASSDNTDSIVLEYAAKYPIIKLISNTKREGAGVRQNQVIETCTSDILILVNSDIFINDKYFIRELIKPITEGVDLTSGSLYGMTANSFFENILNLGMELKHNVFKKYNNGNNLFTCHGSHRAFSKNLYSTFRFQTSVAEDAYSYLFCVKNGYTYAYTDTARAFIKLPEHLHDHISQSSRFFHSSEKLSNFFDESLIKQHSKLPVSLFLIEGLKIFIKKPLKSTLYLLLCVLVVLKAKLSDNREADIWNVVTSSKVVR